MHIVYWSIMDVLDVVLEWSFSGKQHVAFCCMCFPLLDIKFHAQAKHRCRLARNYYIKFAWTIQVPCAWGGALESISCNNKWFFFLPWMLLVTVMVILIVYQMSWLDASDTIGGILGKLNDGGMKKVACYITLMQAVWSKCFKRLERPLMSLILGLQHVSICHWIMWAS